MHEDSYNYSFDPNACEACEGNCCTGESGNIFVNQTEIEAIATHLKLSMPQFKESHLIKRGYKFSIQEHKVGESHDCIFFDRKIKGCGIYPVRPAQCRTFPFWPYFKNNEAELRAECPGIIFQPCEDESMKISTIKKDDNV